MNVRTRRDLDDRLEARRPRGARACRILLERLEERHLLTGGGSDQVTAIMQASSAAGSAGNAQLQSVLADFGNTVASLQSAPSGAAFAEAQVDLANLNDLLSADPALASFAAPLQPMVAASGNSDLNGMLSPATNLFNSIDAVLNQEAAERFTATLSPTESDLSPGQGQTFALQLSNTGNNAENLNLSVGSLPGGASVRLGQDTVSLGPSASTSVSVALSQSVPAGTVFTLDVTASASVVSHVASAVVSVRSAVADVLNVTATPSSVNAGASVTVTASVFDAANATRSLLAQLQVLDSAGSVISTAADVPFSISPSSPDVTVALGPVNTNGLAAGAYQVKVSLLASDGSPLPGNSSEAPLVVGIPASASASVSASPGLVAPGTSTVTTTISTAGTSSAGPGPSNTVDLYFTEYNSVNSVNYVPVTYDGSSVTFGTIVSVATNISADGLLFLPNGNILTAEDTVTEIDPITGQIQSVDGGPGGDHLALDPSGDYAWSSPQPGELEKIPLNPLLPPIPEPLTGDDTQVTALAFDPAGQAFYTTGSPSSAGNFGTINLQTFTTTRAFTDLPAVRGIMYDPYTGDIIIVGLSTVTQIDPKTMTIVSSEDFSSLGISKLDQGSVDGQGHLYVADNTGKLLFIDYSKTGLIGDPSDFVSVQDLGYHLDDVAPLSSLGSLQTSFDVQQMLPSTGYTVAPGSIAPSASSVSSTEIDWLGSLSDSGPTTGNYALTGTVANMSPGEVRPISNGTTVNVTYMASDGQVQTLPIAMAPVSVAAEHVISLLPDTATADRGSQTAFAVRLTNPYATAVTYDLTIEGLGGFNVGLASSITVPAGQTATVPLELTVPLTAAAATTGFQVLASTTGGVTDSVEGELTVMPQVVLRAPGVSPPTSAATTPQVENVQWYGNRAQPTTLVLHFSGPLDKATADKPRDFELLGRRGKRIAIKRARYNATTRTVNLAPVHRLNVHLSYTLIVQGEKPGGLSDAQGQLLGNNQTVAITPSERVPVLAKSRSLSRSNIARAAKARLAVPDHKHH